MKKSIFQDNRYRILLAIGCAIGWSLAHPFIKCGYQSFNISPNDIGGKVLFAGIRFLLAGLLLLIFACPHQKKPFVKNKKDYSWLVLFALVNITFHYMFAYIGLGHIPGSRSTILDSLGGFVLIILAGLIDPSDSFNQKKLLGIILGLTGILCINIQPGQSYFENITWIGDGMLILNGLFGAFGGLLTRFLSKRTNMTYATAFSMTFGGLALILLATLFPPQSQWNITLEGAGILLILVLISAVCFGVYNQLLAYHPISKVAIFNALIPILGVFFSALLLKEPLKIQYIFSVILVSMGIFIVNREA